MQDESGSTDRADTGAASNGRGQVMRQADSLTRQSEGGS